MINYSWTRGENGVKGVEAFVDIIEAFVNIFDGAFEIHLLFDSELGYCKSVRRMILSMLSIE